MFCKEAVAETSSFLISNAACSVLATSYWPGSSSRRFTWCMCNLDRTWPLLSRYNRNFFNCCGPVGHGVSKAGLHSQWTTDSAVIAHATH